MKSFQPKAEGAPPDDEGPGDPPARDIPSDLRPEESEPETNPMPRPTRQNHNAEVDFKGEKRSNATHVSTTDPEARLYKKSPGTGAALCFIGHALMENRRRAGCSGRPDPGRRPRRAARRAGHDPSPFPRIDPAADAGGRQGL
jgi:hypothetical protein